MLQETLPESSLNKLFEEHNATRGDDAYAVLFIQTEVLSACIMEKLKPAIANCTLHQRKFISERDVAIAAEMPSLIPRGTTKGRGRLLHPTAFKNTCQMHIRAAQEVMQRLVPMAEEMKISTEVCLLFQELVEDHLRGYFEEMAKTFSHGRQRVFGYKELAFMLAKLVGHGWNDA